MNFEVDKEGFLPYDAADDNYDFRMRDVDVLLDMLKVLGQVVGPVVWSHTSQAWMRSTDYYAETDDGTADDGTADDTPPPTTPPPDGVHDSEDTHPTDEKTQDNTPPE